jgi:hypothetical protein
MIPFYLLLTIFYIDYTTYQSERIHVNFAFKRTKTDYFSIKNKPTI